MTNSVQYFILILSGTFFVRLSWRLKLLQKFLIKNVPTNILNSVTSLKSKGKKNTFSNQICDHDLKMKGLRFLRRRLAAGFACGELAYSPVQKDGFCQKRCSRLQR